MTARLTPSAREPSALRLPAEWVAAIDREALRWATVWLTTEPGEREALWMAFLDLLFDKLLAAGFGDAAAHLVMEVAERTERQCATIEASGGWTEGRA